MKILAYSSLEVPSHWETETPTLIRLVLEMIFALTDRVELRFKGPVKLVLSGKVPVKILAYSSLEEPSHLEPKNYFLTNSEHPWHYEVSGRLA